MKPIIVFHTLLLSLACVSTNAIANEQLTLQPSNQCDSYSGINNKGFNQESETINLFAYSDRYCINTISSRYTAEKSRMLTGREARQIRKRYRQSYKKLTNTDEKIAFVDLFLKVTTQKHHVGLVKSNEDDVKVVISTYRASSKRVSGYGISLFQHDQVNKQILESYSKYLSQINDVTISSEIVDAVNFVLESNSKKKPERSTSLFNSLTMTYNPKVNIANTGMWDDEEDDDGMDEEDWEELWREEDEDYRDWAEEQAAGWGDDWDYFWGGDEYGDEDWLDMSNDETGEELEAYHFDPKANGN